MSEFTSERLAFNFRGGTVPSQREIDAALAAEATPTFATSPYAEPRDWGYGGLIAFTAVLILRPQDLVPGLNALHLAEICALIGIAPMLLHRLARREPVFRITPETVALIGFAAVIAAVVPFSIWPGGSVDVLTDYVKIVVVFILMMNTLTTPKRLEQITWLIVLCCGYIAAHAVVDYMRGVNLVEGDRVTGSVDGWFGNPNDLAANLVTFMPAALMVALTRRHSVVQRVIAATVAVLMLVAIVFTKSRGGALGLVAMLVAMVFLGRRIRRGFASMALGAVLITTPFMPASFWTRMASIFDEKQDATEYTGSREARRVLLEESFNTFWQYPLTGVGPGQFKNYNPQGRRERWRETHNALLQVAAETGLFGVVAFSFLIVCGATAAARTRRLLAKPRKRDVPDPLRYVISDADRQALFAYTAAMTAGLIGWFTCSLFASVAFYWTFYYLLALIVAAREIARARLGAARLMERQLIATRAVPTARFAPLATRLAQPARG